MCIRDSNLSPRIALHSTAPSDRPCMKFTTASCSMLRLLPLPRRDRPVPVCRLLSLHSTAPSDRPCMKLNTVSNLYQMDFHRPRSAPLSAAWGLPLKYFPRHPLFIHSEEVTDHFRPLRSPLLIIIVSSVCILLLISLLVTLSLLETPALLRR